MKAKELSDDLALAAWRLAEAEGHERKAALHRRAAAEILGRAHASIAEAIKAAESSRQPAGKS